MKHFLFYLFVLLTPFTIKAQAQNELVADSSIAITVSDVKQPDLGFKSILKKSTPYIAPAAMFGFGLLANKSGYLQGINLEIRDEVLENPHSISSKTENVLQYVPVHAVFALNMMGVKSQNNFIDRAFLYALSNTIMSQSVSKLKTITGKLRPDGMDRRSFPSGHTATAFSAAEFMRLEYKDASPIYGIAAYAVAATTGALRVYHNKHWFSDVVAGAGVGILSTDLSYFIYPKVKKFVTNKLGFKDKKLHIGPTYQSSTIGIGLVYNPQ